MPSKAVSGASMVVPSTMMPTAPRPAPAETPTRPGSASGLRNRPCMSDAGDRQRGADQHAEHHARQADIIDDGVIAQQQQIAFGDQAEPASDDG